MILQIALRILVGMALTWCLMPRSAVTVGFFRIQMLVALGLSVLGALTATEPESTVTELVPLVSAGVIRGLCATMACVAFVGSVLWMLGRRSAGLVCCGLLLAIGSATLLGAVPFNRETTGVAVLSGLSEISSAWLMGGSVCAMLLGHWHLTATSMSLVPLTRLTQWLMAAAFTRGVLAGIALLTIDSVEWTGVQQTWLALRWAAGVAGPVVLCAMVLRILKYRNTQSATGVLFAAVILTLIGETTASLLDREFQWPL